MVTITEFEEEENVKTTPTHSESLSLEDVKSLDSPAISKIYRELLLTEQESHGNYKKKRKNSKVKKMSPRNSPIKKNLFPKDDN